MTDRDWLEGVPEELKEMWDDSYARAKKAGKEALEGWKDGTWGIAGRIQELCAVTQERPVTLPVAFDTGIAALNALLGAGLPTGLTELYGASSVGKSSLAYQLIAAAQVSGMRTALCATQRPYLPLMVRLGVEPGELCLLRAECLEDASAVILEELAPREDLFLVIDTATNLRPREETTSMAGFLAALANAMSPSSAALIVNEVRTKKSVDPAKSFCSGTESTAARFASRFPTRLELIRDSVSEEEYVLLVHAVANPNRPPRQYVSLPARKGHGVDVVRSLLETAVSLGVVELRGIWVYFEEERLGGGIRSAADALRKDEMESTLSQLYAKVRALVSGV